jgi:hypothetical protein
MISSGSPHLDAMLKVSYTHTLAQRAIANTNGDDATAL